MNHTFVGHYPCERGVVDLACDDDKPCLIFSRGTGVRDVIAFLILVSRFVISELNLLNNYSNCISVIRSKFLSHLDSDV